MNSQLLDEALKKIPNQQQLVNVISKRVRQLSQGHRPMIELTSIRMGFADIALKEVIDNKLTFELGSVTPAPAV